MIVRLYTKSGGFVAVTQMPPFNPPPEMILWGARSFFYQSYDAVLGEASYREGIVWVDPSQLRVVGKN